MSVTSAAGSAASTLASRVAERRRNRGSSVVGGALGRRRSNRSTAVGTPSPTVDYGSRFESIESRLQALEGGGKPVGDVTQPSATPAPTPGEAVGLDPRTAAFDSIADMPKPQMGAGLAQASQDMFGTEFMRNSAVGAAKMIKNKKI